MTKTSGSFRGRPSACLKLAGVCLLPVLLATCGEDGPGGPSGPPVIGRVEFTPGPITSNGYFGPNLPIDRVHVLIVRPPGDTLRDTTRAFDPNLNRLRFELPVLLTAAAESLDVTLELLSGTTVLFSGTSRLEARAGPPGATPPPAIPLNYIGPGSQIAQLSIAPLDSILAEGDSLIMQVTGLDAGQLPVPAFYVNWSSSDTSVARVNGAGVVRGRVPRGTVFIRARTPNTQLFPSGIVESTTVTLVPDPASLAKISGDNQSAPAGSRLPQLLEVAVLGADGLPVPGVTVAFASAVTGATVDSATATSDANGIARTGVVLGPAVGPQSFTATASGTAPVTFTANASVAPTPTWTGAVSFDWNNAGNWSTGAVPGGADSVTIPAGTPNTPDLTSNVSIAALRNDNVLNMVNFSLTLDGNLRGSGAISGNSTSTLFVAAPATIIDHAAVTNLVISGASVVLARNLTVSGNLTVQGNPANLDLNGHTAIVNGDFATQANGTLTMTNVLDTLRVLDDVLFNGGSTAGKLSSGAIIVVGDFTQQATSSGQSYAPTGNHIDIFAGAGVQTITFATPGATSSNFETLGLANSAGGVTLASDVFLAGPVGFAPGVPRIAHGTGQTLFVAELRASNATLDNIMVTANNVLLTQFDSISFINYSPTATPLTISHPGPATPFVMNDLSFSVTPTSGFYISATDLVADANVLTLNLVNPTPGTSGGLIRTQGGAVVNWPFVPAGSRIWTGAVDSDWFQPGNWNPAIVPSPADDVVIPSTGTAPVLTGSAGVHHLTVQPGATLTSSFDFDVSGDAIVNGSFVGSGIIVMSTHGSSVAGNISNLEIDLATRFESILVSGTLTVNGLIEVQRGHFDLGGHTVTTGNFATIGEGMLRMVNPGDVLIVNGNADFGGEDPTGVLVAGTIRVRGNFVQQTGVTQGSFVATGSNRVILDGTGPQFITFQHPGGSHFQDLELANVSDTLFMGSDWAVTGQLIKAAGGSVVVAGAGQLITASGVAMSSGEFHNARVSIGTGTVSQFDNISWTNFSPFLVQLAVSRANGSFSFSNHTFATTPSTGFYLRADDTNQSDGQPLAINMVNPTPATPGSFVQTVNGAVVNWPAAAGGTTAWTGAVSNNWHDPANWSNGVPTATDDADLTQTFTIQPTISNNTAVRNLAVSSGRVVTVQTGIILTIHGDAVIGGTISGPGLVDMVGTSGNQIAGIFPNLGISAPYTLGGTLEVHGTFLTIQSDLTVGANTITLFANLQVIGPGRLIMTNPNALVGVQGFAVFSGASTVGTMTAGLLGVTGNLTQTATTSSNSFTASGSHLTLLNGAGGQIVTFANPTVSAFQNFQYGGTGSLSLGSDIRVLGAFTSVVPRVISGAGRKLTTGGISTTSGTFDHVLIEVNSTLGGALLSINNTTFQNYPSTATQLSIVHPGSVSPATFDGLTFSSTPTSGFYISAQDQNPSDGLPLTINVTNTTPANGSPFVQTSGGAVVNWPAAPPGLRTWTGATSTDWNTPTNWSPAIVPTSADTVVIPLTANQPVLTTRSVAQTVALAATLTPGGHTLEVGSDLTITGPGSRLMMTNALDSVIVGGDFDFSNGGIDTSSAGVLMVKGDFTAFGTTTSSAFVTKGSHKVVLSGAQLQTARMQGANSNFMRFKNLEISNTGGVTITNPGSPNTLVQIHGRVSVLSPVGVAGLLDLSGSGTGAFGGLSTVAGSMLSLPFLSVNSDSLQVLGGYNVQTTMFRGGSIIPALPYQDISEQSFPPSQFSLGTNVTASGTVGFISDLNLNGHSLTVGGAFFMSGRLTMTNAADILTIAGNATFDGPDHTGLLTQGVITVGGNFTQGSTMSPLSFFASGGHRTVLNPAAPASVTFSSPTSSLFRNLDVSTASGTITMGSDMTVAGQFTALPAGPVPLISGGATKRLLTVSTPQISGLTLDNVELVTTGAQILQLDNVTIQNITLGDALAINNPGQATPYTFSNIVFTSVPSSNYILANDLAPADGNVLTINMVNPTPANAAGKIGTAGGAVVNWPATAGAVTWIGIASTDWNSGANWSGGAVPTSAQDVIIPSGTPFSPIVTVSCAARSLTVNNGATLNLSGIGCVVQGDVLADGTITNTFGVLDIQGAGNLRGNLPGETTINASVTVTGPITVNGRLLISGTTGALTVNGQSVDVGLHLITSGNGVLVMTNPADLVTIAANSFFGGGDETGKLTAGRLRASNLTQTAGTSPASFAASGTHVVELTANNTGLFMQSAGAGAGSSHIQELVWSGSGGGIFFLQTGSPYILGTTTVTSGGNFSSTGGTYTLHTGQLLAGGALVFQNTQLSLEPGIATPISLSNITFTVGSGFSPFLIRHPGLPFGAKVLLDQLTFTNVPTLPAVYLDVDDTAPGDGNPLVVDVTNSTPSSPSGLVIATNGATINWPAAVGGGTSTWTGAVSTDWAVGGNWSGGVVPSATDSVVIPASGNQPVLTANAFTGALHLANGTLTLNGQFMAVARTFVSTGSGRLVMTNPNDGLSINGDAIFDGGNQLGFMTEGVMVIGGDLTQLATNSPDSYHPSGNHTTVLFGVSPTVTFATPGLVPGSSHFQRLHWTGTGTLTMGSNVFAHAELVLNNGSPTTITGNGRTITAGGFFGATWATTFDNVNLVIDQASSNPLTISNLIFANQDPAVVQLSIRHPGTFLGGVTTQSVTFLTTPSPGGFFLRAEDMAPLDGTVLTVDMNNVTPPTPGSFVQTAGGAVVNWPAAGGAGIGWNGTVSTDWFDPANWNGGVVPGDTDDVTIPGALNQPVLTSDVTVNTFQTIGGGFIDIDGNDLVVNGHFSGTATSSSPSGFVVMAGTGVSLSGSAPNLQITGSVSANGVVNIQENLSVLGSGAHLRMITPGIVVLVGGNATFEGGDGSGDMIEGVLQVQGDLIVLGTFDPFSFGPSGNHTTELANLSGPQTISMTNVGLDGNHFHNLSLLSPGQFNLAQDVFVGGTLTTGGPGVVVQGSASEGLHIRIPMINGLVLSNARLLIENTVATVMTLDGVTFQQMDPNDDQLTINLPGGPGTHTFNNIVFTDVPTGGLYLFVADNTADANILTIDMVNPTPASGSGFIGTTGGAVVNWP